MQLDDHLIPVPTGRLLSRPWALSREAFPHVLSVAKQRVSPDAAGVYAEQAPRAFKLARPKATRAHAKALGAPSFIDASSSLADTDSGLVAIVPLTGVITPRSSLLSWLLGGSYGGLVGFQQDLTDAMSDPQVTAVVIDVDSPGGMTDLVPETAALMRTMSGTKPMVAVANTLAASAAYWLAAQADSIAVTPSGRVGSVGAFMVHEDWSGWNEKQGIQPTYISAGKFKVDGNEDEPLSDTARDTMQQWVDDVYGMFVSDLAAGRGITTSNVVANYGQGNCLIASRAIPAGMADSTETLDQVVNRLLPGLGSGGAPSARTTKLPARAQQLLNTPRAASPEAGDGDADDQDPGAQPRCANCGQFIPADADGDLCDSCAPDPDDAEPVLAPDADPTQPDAATASAHTRRMLADLLG